MDSHDTTTSTRLNGQVAIKEGKLIIIDPADTGRDAEIIPGNNVTIIVNGEVIHGPTSVSNSQDVEIKPKKTEIVKELKLNVAKDKTSASLTVVYKSGEEYYLDDTDFSEKLIVECYRSKIFDMPFTDAEVTEFLKTKGIVYGISEDAIKKAIVSGEDTVVAVGKPFVLGQPGWIEELVLDEEPPDDTEEMDSIIKDRFIKMVKVNQPLARFHPATEGEPGLDVYGKEVPPPKPKEAKLIAGPGTKLTENGHLLLAAIEGRLEKKKGNMYSVLPVYQVDGDAEAKVGYIKFKGDVVINGNVLDGMKIDCGGKIEIYGYCANSTLIAGGDIIVHNNLVGCTVQAGGAALIHSKLKDSLLGLEEKLRELGTAAKSLKRTLEQNNQARADGAILKVLLEQKYIGLPNLVSNVLKVLNEAKKLIDKEDEEKLKLLQQAIEHGENWASRVTAMGPLQINSMSDYDRYLADFFGDNRKLLNELKGFGSEGASVKCPYIQNCDVQANGDVIIKGKGCYNSKIYAGGNVEITGTPGVFRGGSITAGGWVKAVEIGSTAEIPTFIQVEKTGFVKASLVHAGTIVKCGHRIEKFTEKANALHFTV
ncbi:MAG: FapA family protein [Bacillota bacterium]